LIPITAFKNKLVALFGLGKSGLATARAMTAGGSEVIAFDDNPDACERADVRIEDLRQINWSHIEALILAPGIPLEHPSPHWTVDMARSAGVKIIGDLELMACERRLRGMDSKLIAVTGTNGKSTTVALITHLLQSAGLDAQSGGNIGYPALEMEDFAPGRHYVVEVSSFQADLTSGLDPDIGVITNVSPDHLDRHLTMDKYITAKGKVLTRAGVAVVGVDDDFSVEVSHLNRVLPVSIKRKLDHGYYVTGPVITAKEPGNPPTTLGDLTGIKSLRGRHNAQNASCAAAVAHVLGLNPVQIAKGLQSFPGLPHRIEEIGQIGNVMFVNDSKATSATAAAQAIACFDNIHWILGGKAKTDGIEPLTPMFHKIARAYLIGDATEKFARFLDGKVPFEACHTIDRGLRSAFQRASMTSSCDNATFQRASMTSSCDNATFQRANTTSSCDNATFQRANTASSCDNATVLLSPACASYDQFKDFEERGDCFRKLVIDLIESAEKEK